MFNENLKFTFDIEQYNIANTDIKKNLNMKLFRKIERKTLNNVHSFLYNEIITNIYTKSIKDV